MRYTIGPVHWTKCAGVTELNDQDLSDQVIDWLNVVEAARGLGQSDRRYALLRYLIDEELNGRGAQIKAYTIALDVFGRGADFDASGDSIVRVEMGRLRDALALYYAKQPDGDHPVVKIPKGTYRPQVSLPPVAAIAGTTAVTSRQSSIWRYLLILVVAIAAGGGFAVWQFTQSRTETGPDATPVLQIASFDTAATEAHRDFAIGFRQQLVTDLSHLPTIIVRDGPLRRNAIGRDEVAAPDYELTILSVGTEAEGLLSLKLSTVGDGAVVWARTIEVAQADRSFYENVALAVRGIGQEIAGPTGAITNQQARDALNLAEDDISTQSDYACLVISLVFDATKSESAGARSQECLNRAIANNTQNAALRAEYALRLFFVASELTDPREREEALVRAEEQARIAISLNPFDALPYEVLGNIESSIGRRSAAIANYTRAVELAPSRPAPHFLLGWQTVLQGDWDAGMVSIRDGLAMQPDVPGYMIVPLALDAFRRADYAQSLDYAQAIITRGDQRGYTLAFAASVAMGDISQATRFFEHPNARTATDPRDPMREVRVTFSNPDIMGKYEDVIAQYAPPGPDE